MLERSSQRFSPQGAKNRALRAGVSVGIGCAIGFVLWMGGSGGLLWSYLLVCGWIGLAIYFVASALFALARPVLARFEGWRLRIVVGLLYFVAGAAGFSGAVASLDWVLRHTLGGGVSVGESSSALLSVGFPGLVGLVAGLTFFTYDSLRERLRLSVERIKEQEHAEHELETARAIQRRLLPPPVAEGPGYRIAARNLPAHQVAGDFYDILPDLAQRPDGAPIPTDGGTEGHGSYEDRGAGSPEDRGTEGTGPDEERSAGEDDGRSDGGDGDRDGVLGLAVGDVSGKGMGASLVMASVKASLSFLAPGRSPAEILVELNRRLVAELGPREFVALCFVLYHPSTGAFELANAGLPDPYLVRVPAGPEDAPGGAPDGEAPSGGRHGAPHGEGSGGTPPEAVVAPEPRLPLGLREGMAYGAVRGRLDPGDRLVLVTDGLPEAQTGEGEPLGYAGFEQLLAATTGHRGEPERWLDGLFERLAAETLEHREDDWTALVLERSA